MVFRLDRDREKKLASNRTIVRKKESQIMEHARKIREIKSQDSIVLWEPKIEDNCFIIITFTIS